MDLGCIDMGCIEKQKKETSLEKDNSPREAVNSASKLGKNNRAKDAVRSSINALNKLTSQITKPPHRNSSPVNWFPRKKVEPYLKRKIKMLQEVNGMNLTLDETLGDSNPHYSKVLREKMATREAAEKAMESRKAAMIEASWCRILQAARIESKEAEAQLLKAETFAAEAFEAARALGVILSDIPECAQNHCKIESLSKGGSTTHTVLATFETAFEVDKQVAAAVKAAFIKLANCPSINKDEFKELLVKISETPDTNEYFHGSSYIISECESGDGSESEVGSCKDGSDFHDMSDYNNELAGTRHIKHEKRQGSDKFNMNCIVELMLDRLRCLKEEELASLATIVATCGLNAALAAGGNNKTCDLTYRTENTENPVPKPRSRISVGGRTAETVELPSLDKFLVKRLTKLEKDVLEAKNARNSDAIDNISSMKVKHKEETTVPDLGSILVKHSSKLEKEVQEARMNNKKLQGALAVAKQEVEEVLPSLDKFLVKRLTRLEREVQEARNKRTSEPTNEGKVTDLSKTETLPSDAATDLDGCNGDTVGKENMDLNRSRHTNNSNEDTLSSKKAEASVFSDESLDKVLVKHVSRLEREKMGFRADEQMRMRLKRKDINKDTESSEGSLDQVLVKHKSRLEMEKIAAASKQHETNGNIRNSVSRRQARERELQEAWGGLSLGNSIRPHVSRLERDKAAWLKAEEEERNRSVEEVQ